MLELFRAPKFTYEDGFYVWRGKGGTTARSVYPPERRGLADYAVTHLFWSYSRTIKRIVQAFRHKESK